METCMPENEFTNADTLAKLVTTALAQDKLSGLSEMLGVIAKSIEAPIAILWQQTPKPIEDTLFMLAEWFEEPQDFPTYFHTLKRTTAATSWRAIDTGEWQTKSGNEKLNSPFFKEFGIKGMLSIPLYSKKSDSDQKKYALNFYWTTDPNLTEEQNQAHIDKAIFFAQLLLDLYHSLTDKVSYTVVNYCNNALSKLNNESSNFIKVSEEICNFIAETLHVREVSIYLFDDPENNDSCTLQATTWGNTHVPKKRTLSNNNSLTDWVLNNRKAIQIFDLALYKDYSDKYKHIYPGLNWNEATINNIGKHLRKTLEIPAESNLPPLSFVAIPIIYGDKLLGVIRCCSNKKAPYYFSEQKKMLLTLVANQIAQARDSWLNRENINKENTALSSFLTSLVTLNGIVLEKISSNEKLPKDVFKNTLQDEVFLSALGNIHEAVNTVEISAIRLVNKTDNCLYFAKVYGKETPDAKYDLDEADENGEPVKAGVWVYKHKKTLVIDGESHPLANPLRRFKAKSMIISPIKIADEVIGVIDVRNTTKMFPPFTQPMVELIGNQLGLYSYLFDKIVALKDSVETLEVEKRQQTQTYEDFTHQLKSPIQHLKARANSFVDNYKGSDPAPKQVLYLRGLASKALRVTQSIRLFADLSKNAPIKPLKTRLKEDVLTKILIECAIDQGSTIDSKLNIDFSVHKEGLNALNRVSVEADYDLLVQAISNLLDNAAKYSFPDTRVEIYCGLTGKQNFHITVKNEGLPLHEAEKCKERNWRGAEAKLVTGEGSGIGLWIVDAIMKAHDGRLIIIPTEKDITKVKLLFPTKALY